MAKKRSKDSGKGKRQAATTKGVAVPGASDGKAAAIDPAASKAALKLSSSVRKQIRRLERQLADAALQELKRLRKLERARHRRQVAEAALADVLAETPAPPALAAKPAPAVKPAPVPKPAPAATRRAPAAKAAASTPRRTRAAGTATSARRATPKPTPAKPATPPDSDKP
jgi:hypothetical protein